MLDSINKNRKKGKEFVDNIEQKIGSKFPTLKAVLGGVWTLIWFIIAFTVQAIIILIPILAIIAGIVFIIFLIATFDGDFPVFIGSGGNNDKKKKHNEYLE